MYKYNQQSMNQIICLFIEKKFKFETSKITRISKSYTRKIISEYELHVKKLQ